MVSETKEEMRKRLNPRADIEELILKGDLKGLLRRAGELHGHYCTFLAMGVKAGALGLKKMGLSPDGMEHVLAIVECNNCFTDGVQFSTACSFGNNALIYKDFGKTAVSLVRRDGSGIRILVKPEALEVMKERYPEQRELFEKVVKDRSGTEEDMRRFKDINSRASFDILEVDPELVFKVEEVKVDVPDFAPIFDNIQCTNCGENVMATRIVDKDGVKLCIPCAKAGHLWMDGSGLKNGHG